MEALSISSVSETYSLLHPHHRTPSSSVAAIAVGTPRLTFLKIAQHSHSHSLVAPLRLSALPTQLPNEEGDEAIASGLASQPQENLIHSENCDNDDTHEPIQTGMSWSTITNPGGSGSGGGTRAGLFRTPISGGVQSATSAHGLPRPALAVRNLMEQARFAHLCTVMSRMHHRREGYPFGSLVDFAPDSMGHPIFSFSPLTIHTRNLLADPRCTLVVQIPGWRGLSNARVTIFGDVYPLPEDQQEWAHKQYMAKHHQGPSQQWGNFYYFRMQNISDIYFIGGFGTVAWVDVKEYEVLQPDKIAVDGGEQYLKELNAIFSKPLKKIISEEIEVDDVADELYEHINAPKWVDFLSLDHSPLDNKDDEAWFCKPDCKHPKTAEDFLRSTTPSKARSPVYLSENLPCGDQNRRDVKIKRRVPPLSSSSPQDDEFRFNDDSENQNPNLSAPPIKSMKASIKSSEEKKKLVDDTFQDNLVLPSLRSTLSAKNLFTKRPILNQITEFCNELKKLALATRARERENAENLSPIESEEEVVQETTPPFRAFEESNRREKERKPLLEVGKAERLEGIYVKGKLNRKKRPDEAENMPITRPGECTTQEGQ